MEQATHKSMCLHVKMYSLKGYYYNLIICIIRNKNRNYNFYTPLFVIDLNAFQDHMYIFQLHIHVHWKAVWIFFNASFLICFELDFISTKVCSKPMPMLEEISTNQNPELLFLVTLVKCFEGTAQFDGFVKCLNDYQLPFSVKKLS